MLLRLASAFLVSLSASNLSAAEFQVEFIGASAVELDNPHDLKLSPDGRYLLVSDVGNDRVAILDPDTLALVSEFGSDHQSGTHDVDFDAMGRAHVADTHNNRITIYEMNGAEATLAGELTSHIRGPEGVLAHPNGRIGIVRLKSSARISPLLSQLRRPRLSGLSQTNLIFAS